MEPFEWKIASNDAPYVRCRCGECGASKTRFVSPEKEYTGGFIQFLAPVAAAVAPYLLQKLFG